MALAQWLPRGDTPIRLLCTNPDWIYPSIDRPLLLTTLVKKIVDPDLVRAKAVRARLAVQYGIELSVYGPVVISPTNVTFGMKAFGSIHMYSPMILQRVLVPTASWLRLRGRHFRSLSMDTKSDE